MLVTAKQLPLHDRPQNTIVSVDCEQWPLCLQFVCKALACKMRICALYLQNNTIHSLVM